MSEQHCQTPPSVVLTHVEKSFDGRPVLSDINFDVEPGEFVALLGRSGSGKTTILRLLARLERADSGAVQVPSARSAVFQEPRLIPSMRVWKNVVFGLRGARGHKQVAIDALTEVGLPGHHRAWPATLSGGEAQRVALARALTRQPELLLLDEPFASLDALTRIRMHDLVNALWGQHSPAVVLVTHDVDEAVMLADRILVLTDGTISLDITNAAPRPRRYGDRSATRLRQQLLDELGVHEATASTD
jgi:sulfonate transport system ATP-binding protein